VLLCIQHDRERVAAPLIDATSTHCNMLQHAAKRCNALQHAATRCNTLQHTAHCRSAAHRSHSNGATRRPICSVLQCVAARCSVFLKAREPAGTALVQCVVVCCSVLQCIAACCSVLVNVREPAGVLLVRSNSNGETRGPAERVVAFCSALQCKAVRRSVLNSHERTMRCS